MGTRKQFSLLVLLVLVPLVAIAVDTRPCVDEVFVDEQINETRVYKLLREVRACVIEGKLLTVYISSEGGDAISALAFFDEITTRGWRKNFVAQAFGTVSSAANILFLASDWRITTKGSVFIWHPVTLRKIPTGESAPDYYPSLKEVILLNYERILHQVLQKPAADILTEHIRNTRPGRAYSAEEMKKMGVAKE